VPDTISFSFVERKHYLYSGLAEALVERQLRKKEIKNEKFAKSENRKLLIKIRFLITDFQSLRGVLHTNYSEIGL